MTRVSQNTLSEEWLPEGRVICVGGTVDLGGIEALHERLDDAVRNSDADLTLDLRETSFLDAAALQLLLVISGRLTRRGRRLSIVCPGGPGLELFAVSGLHQLFTIYPTRETAWRAERSRRWERRSSAGARNSPPLAIQ